MPSQNPLIRFLRASVRWIDRFRRILHLFVMLFLFSLILTLIARPKPVVPASAALVIDPQGALVDQLSGDPLQRALALAQGHDFSETLLPDLIEAVRQAQGDRRIKALVLKLDGLGGAGLSKLQELNAQIEQFKQSGKPVYAIGAGFDRDQYYLASAADKIFMHPMGVVLIDGYSAYIPYFKSALDKLYVDYNAWTIGEYKSFTEPYTRNDMSDADRVARSDYLHAMWNFYQRDVEAARGLDRDSLQHYADDFADLVTDEKGDTGKLAVDYGLVDEALPYDEINARVRAVVGGDADSDSGFQAINVRNYLTALRGVGVPEISSRKVGLIVATGTILDGLQPPGSIGSDSLIQLIRRARADDSIRALVVRVDSPGGSAFASELIRRELELFRETGRPLVVSMGSVAASGGYWISTSADEIWASPTTLTGSIGVGATMPSFDRTLGKLGIHVDGLGTTALDGQMDPTQGIGEDIRRYIQVSIEKTYEDFISTVANGRKLDPAAVEASAQGRVWIGSEAQTRGLVDHLGGLDQAVASAAELAGLSPGGYSLERLKPNLGWAEQFALNLVKASAPVTSAMGLKMQLPKSLVRLIDAAAEPLAFLDELNDPRGIYSYCFCDTH